METISAMFDAVLAQISTIGVFDILDIAIVSVIFYYIYKFVRDRRAGRLAIGILLVLVIMFLSEILEMQLLHFLIEKLVQVGVIGLIILFQAELRSFLEKMGGKSLSNINLKKDRAYITETLSCIDAVVEAVGDFAAEKTGALIIFERTTKLGDVIKTGTVIDAEPGAYMIKNIFFNKAPMHDGALIIRHNRLYSAGCFLPLSTNPEIIKDLGTRHRAGIGMSENSDAAVVIVSEETGTISLALDGHLTRDYDTSSLKKTLVKLLLADTKKKTSSVDNKSSDSNETDMERKARN